MRQLLFAFAAVLVLLAGCTGVPQERYDALKAQCEQEKNALSDTVDTQKASADAANRKLETCNNQIAGNALVLKSNEEEITALKKESATLALARTKTNKIEQYRQLLVYFEDAFGPGKIANIVRIRRIEDQLALIFDPEMEAAWQAVKKCQSSTECDNAKRNFSGTVDSKVSVLASEVVTVVKQN